MLRGLERDSRSVECSGEIDYDGRRARRGQQRREGGRFRTKLVCAQRNHLSNSEKAAVERTVGAGKILRILRIIKLILITKDTTNRFKVVGSIGIQANFLLTIRKIVPALAALESRNHRAER